MLAQIESLESSIKLLQKDVENAQKDAEKERKLLQKDAEKERKLLQKDVDKERELRELAVKAAQAEVDKGILDLTFHGDYGELRRKAEDIKESVSEF